MYPTNVEFIYCNPSNSSLVYFVVIFSSSISFMLYTYIDASFFCIVLVSTLICFTGISYLYGLLDVYLFQSFCVNVTSRFPVSSSYTFIHPSSPSNVSAPLKYIPTFDTTSSTLSVLESVFINWSDTCPSPSFVSFIIIPSNFAFVPTYPLHVTVYVSPFSSSLIPLYILSGFSFDTIYLELGEYTCFPTVTSKDVSYISPVGICGFS